MSRARHLLVEALVSSRSQPVASLLTILIIAGMVITVMLTTGRAIAAERQVVASIDAAGTRTIVIRGEEGSGLAVASLQRMSLLSGIEWAGGFAPAIDASNTVVPDDHRSPVREVFTDRLDVLGVAGASPSVGGQIAYASPLALSQFGMVEGAGGVTLTTGLPVSVVGTLDVPDFMTELEPLTLIPAHLVAADGETALAIVVVVVESPSLVGPVTDALLTLIGGEDPSRISIQTSEQLAQLRAVVEGQLSSFSRGLVAMLLVLAASVVTVLLYGLVIMRRRDFGRRRALGATRALIIGLLLLQISLLAAVGLALGTSVSLVILAAGGGGIPGVDFLGALAVLTLCMALAAAVVPAIVASRRDPVQELRVP